MSGTILADIDPENSDVADDVDLQTSLAALSRLAMGAGQKGLEDLLAVSRKMRSSRYPRRGRCGPDVIEADRVDTMVASADFVREVDAIQYRIGEGPCITAAAEGRTVHSGSLGGTKLWPRFGPRVGRLGVHSVLSLPLLVGGDVLGAMNVYAHAKNAFDDRAVHLGERAGPAAISVLNARAARPGPTVRRAPAGSTDKPNRHRSSARHHDEPRRVQRRRSVRPTSRPEPDREQETGGSCASCRRRRGATRSCAPHLRFRCDQSARSDGPVGGLNKWHETPQPLTAIGSKRGTNRCANDS